MKRFQYTLAIALIISPLAIPDGDCAVIPSGDIGSAVSDTLAAVASRNGLEITSDVSYLANIQCNTEGRPGILVEAPDPSQLAGRIRAGVVITDGDGIAVRRISVPVKVIRFETVAVLAQDVGRGTEVTPDMVVYERREVLSPGDCFLKGDALGCKNARRNLKTGDVLTSKDVKAVPVIERGDTVQMRVQVGNVVVTAFGIARESGGVDDSIRVYNSDTRTTITCTIIDAKTVRIDG